MSFDYWRIVIFPQELKRSCIATLEGFRNTILTNRSSFVTYAPWSENANKNMPILEMLHVKSMTTTSS